MRNAFNEFSLHDCRVIARRGLILTAALTTIDPVQLNLKLLSLIQREEVDDILSALTLVLVGLAIDRFLTRNKRRRLQQAEIEAQKLRTHRATMRTVQDIVNNFLNNLMLFEIPAKGDMPPGSVATVEGLIQHTSRQLRSLGDLESVVETSLAVGAGIAYPQS